MSDEALRMFETLLREPFPGQAHAIDSVLKGEGKHTPPQGVRSACRQGLKLAPEHGGKGLTEGAKARARSMAAGEKQTDSQVKRIKNFTSRHGGYPKKTNPPSPGHVAWQLWGGDAGKRWAESKTKTMDDKTKKARKRKLVGGNKGAWATAKEQAKGKRNPKAYAAAVMGKITGKKSMSGTCEIYKSFLSKSDASHGAGSTGGVGTTSTGKAVVGHDHAAYAPVLKQTGTTANTAIAVRRAFPHYTVHDHQEAAQMHFKAMAAKGAPTAHLASLNKIAHAHYAAAS